MDQETYDSYAKTTIESLNRGIDSVTIASSKS